MADESKKSAAPADEFASMGSEKAEAGGGPGEGSKAEGGAKGESKTGSMRRRKPPRGPGKRLKAAHAMAPAEPLSAPSAIAALKKFPAPKFDQSVEVCLHLGVDVKQADQMLRGSVSLPKGIGKSKRVVAFCDDAVVKDALEAGAVKAGGADLVQEIEKGWMDFDVAVASPDMMRVISKLGRVLGPKGLMPSPKNGTVTPKVADAVAEFAAGKVEYRTDKSGNVHAVIGKMSFAEGDLLANYEHFFGTIMSVKPAAVKGVYVKKVTLSGTQTPGVQVQLAAEEAGG